ncbi:hypothetical protein [Acidiphilium angustum]|nr:hypothetical protein [Acidiphilium angustum]
MQRVLQLGHRLAVIILAAMGGEQVEQGIDRACLSAFMSVRRWNLGLAAAIRFCPGAGTKTSIRRREGYPQIQVSQIAHPASFLGSTV